VITPKIAIASIDVADHYDDLDRWYLELWGEHLHHGLWLAGNESTSEATHNLVARLAERLGIGTGQRVCDIGCGYGATARVLVQEYGASVTGLTLSESQYIYTVARRDATDDPQVLRMDFMDNDFSGAAFDAAISVESSEHFVDKPALFNEMYRIVKPGGRIGVYAWLAAGGATQWQVDHLLEPICREGRLPSIGTEQDYRGWLDGAAFADIAYEDYSRNVMRTWPIVVGRMAKRLTWDREAWAFLFSGARNREFGKTVFRIWMAYKMGCMRYGLFTARKPESPVAPSDACGVE